MAPIAVGPLLSRRRAQDTAQGLVQSEDPLWQRPLENVRKVGQGSSGIVWKARVPGTLEDIAVKTIPLTSRRQHSFAVSELAHLDQYSGGDVVSLFDAAIANMYEDGVFLSSEQPVLLLYMEAAAGSLYEVVLGSSGFEHIALSTRLRRAASLRAQPVGSRRARAQHAIREARPDAFFVSPEAHEVFGPSVHTTRARLEAPQRHMHTVKNDGPHASHDELLVELEVKRLGTMIHTASLFRAGKVLGLCL